MIVIVVCQIPGMVSAQSSNLIFDEFVIEFWPEYDQPDVLVIYRGKLSSQVTLPAEITFQIPTAVGRPNAVAFRDDQGQLIPLQETRVVRGELAEITFTTSFPEIQFEYYDPALVQEGDTRSYSYLWPDQHTVNQAQVWVQTPKGANQLDVNPALDGSLVGQDGMVYAYDRFENFSPQFTINFSYQKQSDALSVEGETVEASAPIEAEIPASFFTGDWIPLLLAGMGALAILSAGLLYWWYQGSRGKELVKSVLPEEKSNSAQPNFCPKCGNPAQSGDFFCRICGEKY
jgi:hypothetical protein